MNYTTKERLKGVGALLLLIASLGGTFGGGIYLYKKGKNLSVNTTDYGEKRTFLAILSAAAFLLGLYIVIKLIIAIREEM